MSKATFVSSIPSKIEGNEVPTLNLMKSMIPDVVKENTIKQYTNYSGVEWILPEGSKFKVGEAHLGLGVPISIEKTSKT